MKSTTPALFRPLFSLVAAIVVVCLPAGLVRAAQPQPSPLPSSAASASPTTPAPKPSALTISGYARAFDFQRENQTQNAANPNRTAFNLGGLLKLDYNLFDSGFHIGAGYYGAYPFGANGHKPQLNAKIDNTLPGYSLSTTGQLYLAYDKKSVKFAVGDLNLNQTWLPASDSRLKPALYQGADLAVAVVPNVTLGLTRITAFENRTQSDFERQTLLGTTPSAGVIEGSLAYKRGDNFVNFQYLGMYDYDNLAYFDAGVGLAPASEYKPTLSVQYVTEHQAGTALLGLLDNDTYGAKVSTLLTKGYSASFGVDDMPARYLTVASSSLTGAEKGIFVPSGGSPAGESLGGGLYKIAYGGIASPYTDTYTSDPLYTTSISQGLVERHGPGLAFKGTLSYISDNRRFLALLSEAYYNYSNEIAQNHTYETDVDATYRFMAVKKGPYHGLSFRERFANRTQDTLPYEFRYLREQLEYDF